MFDNQYVIIAWNMAFYGENDEKPHYNLILRGSLGKVIKSLSQPIKYTEVIRMGKKKEEKDGGGGRDSISAE